MNIYYIEPYLGFSHKHWIEGYQRHSSHQIEVFGLPARHWKWRMNGGAISVAQMLLNKPVPDLFLVSDMIDLPLFKSLLADSFKNVPVYLYFHENQFAYPLSKDHNESVDYLYGFINLKSALVAEKVFFNSNYNLESFLTGGKELLKLMPDYSELSWISKIKEKSKVLPLGLEYITETCEKEITPPLILWNHRWEHDKNPELFFKTLIELKEEGESFRLAVLGEEFRSSPEIFTIAKEKLKEEIVAWGFQERSVYEKLVSKAALLPVTSHQDFFGISIVEAVRAGVKPILPKRLAYPENFPEEFFFENDSDFKERLKVEIIDYNPVSDEVTKALDRFSWKNMASQYDKEFSKI